MVQFSHLYTTIRETIALTIQTFVSKVMSLLFNMLLRFVIVFLWRSNCLLILWLKSLSALTFEPKETKSITFSSSLLHEVLLRSFNGLEPGGPELKIRKWKRKRKRLIFLGLHRKPMKSLIQGSRCSRRHLVPSRGVEGTVHLLERALEAQAGEWAWQVSMLQWISQRERDRQTERKKERKTDTGTETLMEQRCFIQHSVSIFTVLQGSYFQQR